jgi:hypothetical protein
MDKYGIAVVWAALGVAGGWGVHPWWMMLPCP